MNLDVNNTVACYSPDPTPTHPRPLSTPERGGCLVQPAIDDRLGAMAASVEAIRAALAYCSYNPGADITITVSHKDLGTVTAKLYDRACLVDSLDSILYDFIEDVLA